MSTTRKVAVLVGSLRKGSFNRMTAKALAALAPAELQLEIVEISQLPLYNQDDDDAPPAPWVAFRAQVKPADAVLFVTPEYNRSVPGVLKKMRSTWARVPMDITSGIENRQPWLASRRARSAVSAPIITCANHLYF